jgi:hypothetical protein
MFARVTLHPTSSWLSCFSVSVARITEERNAKALHGTDGLALLLDGDPVNHSGPKDKIEARRFGERSEVPVSREQRNPSVDAALGNQRIAEACLAALRKHFRSQLSRSLPISRFDLDQRHICQRFGNPYWELRVA